MPELELAVSVFTRGQRTVKTGNQESHELVLFRFTRIRFYTGTSVKLPLNWLKVTFLEAGNSCCNVREVSIGVAGGFQQQHFIPHHIAIRKAFIRVGEGGSVNGDLSVTIVSKTSVAMNTLLLGYMAKSHHCV